MGRTKKMNKAYMVVFFALVVFGLIVALSYEPNPSKTSVSPTVKNVTTATIDLNVDCESIDDVDKRDGCFLSDAVREDDRKMCNKISTQNRMLSCVARVEKDPKLCNLIDVLRESDWCLHKMAFALGRVELCEGIHLIDIRDSCIFSYVMDKKPEPMRCLDIINSTLRDKCIFTHMGRYTREGKQMINPRLCPLIEDPALELKCNQTYLG